MVQITDQPCSDQFENGSNPYYIYQSDNPGMDLYQVIGKADLHRGLYLLQVPDSVNCFAATCSNASDSVHSVHQFKNSTAMLVSWHDRLGHPSDHVLHMLKDFSCVETPQQNAVAETKHQHLLAVARALYFQSKVPGHRDKFNARALPGIFLGYASGVKGYKIYVLQTRNIQVSRDIVFHEHIYPFRSIISKDLPIDPFFDLSLPTDSIDNGYVVRQDTRSDVFQDLNPTHSDPVDNQVPDPVDSRTASSMQHDHSDQADSQDASPIIEPIIDNYSEDSASLEPVISNDDQQNVIDNQQSIVVDQQPVEIQPRRSSRISHKPSYLVRHYQMGTNHINSTCSYPIEDYISSSRLSDTYKSFIGNISSVYEPSFYHQAVKYPEWREAMHAELKAMEDLHTWTVVPLPSGKQPIDCKWVYRVKYKADGSIDRCKARLVAKGFTQIEGIDYTDTFSPVAKLTSFKILLALAAVNGWNLLQLDVNNEFLNGQLDEEVYMKLPLGYETKVDAPNLVCKLNKSIYGLKQASRQWFSTFSQAVLKFGFNQSPSDHSLFTVGSGDKFVALMVYVDDIILAGKDTSLLAEVQDFLQQNFKLKVLVPLKYFFGFEVARNTSGISLSQRHYALQLLEDTGSLGKKPANLPINPSHKLSSTTGDLLPDPQVYRRLIGRLLYLTHTRPDITYAVHLLSQYVSSPRTPHLDAAYNLLAYIKKDPGLGLFFPVNNNLQLSAFVDADYGACPNTRRSTTGFCTYNGDCLISWKSKKQHTVSRSSCEAEYRAMASATCELVWIAALLSSFHIATPTVFLYCDNQAAIYLASNQVFHERSKHIEVDCHFIRDKVSTGFLKLFHVRSSDQLADIFTKGLHLLAFTALMSKLKLLNIHQSSA
ncbi:hypothetical protein HRI_002259000 [Hibiscus trionum]|uniref:Reverse transcriptase Ty1/copia-type domain-containing protein n=1 Tax=Hibiscus trionum TaxID=183268 RepID=A0A9W7HYT4_HIBTR|nr:hypothetical protein HRI_002259000 [Hibiscus trionum]